MPSDAGHNVVYLALGATDLRKSIDGLAAIVSVSSALEPFSPCLFVFCNRGRDKLKIVRWQHNGWWLYYRRLERGHFRWPASDKPSPLSITSRELQWLLDGLPLQQRQAHPEVRAKRII